jgi:hypothetical protein
LHQKDVIHGRGIVLDQAAFLQNRFSAKCYPWSARPSRLPSTHRCGEAGPPAVVMVEHSTTERPSPPPAALLGLSWAVLATMRSAPDHTWRARDIARTLGITGEKGLNSFCVQMSTWAHRGLFTKTAPATYTIT